MRLDFHMHTWLSDGGIAPKQLESVVRSRKLKAWSITDHDTLAAYDHVDADPALIPGVEITCEDLLTRVEVHVVALGINLQSVALREFLAAICALRERRIQALVDDVNARFDLQVDLEQVRTAHCEMLTRSHLAETLLRVGPWSNRRQLFSEVISDEQVKTLNLEAYPSIAQAVAVIHEAGGQAILAHPARYSDHQTIERLMAEGLDGLEVKHPHVPAETEIFMRELVEKNNYLMSCGSDLHFLGRRQPGDCRLSHAEASPLLQRLQWIDPLIS
ncbi:MAG: hypothetical protein HRU15_16970 [Planctomycetes bacterium]|nr:hypothetical protein [Planctomycetota bacterium]